ncbi:MAG: nucleotidyltransferase domain-containing protein [Elusimicrobia bacterium]|nr:nucleotidyltransferase domain-containing protein [Elusimicrobiota bacterium]
MDPDIQTVLDSIVSRLRRDYPPQKVILYGSYAYGSPTPDSDLDLLIVIDTPENFWDRSFRVCRLVSDLCGLTPFQPLVLTPAELSNRLAVGDQFLQEIVAKGRVLYDS